MSHQLPSKSPTVLFKEMDEGGVLFCSRTEIYFGLNSVGAIIWNHLPEGAPSGNGSVGKLLDSLHEAYPDVDRDDLAADVREFLETLETSQLVTYARSEETKR